MSRTLTIELPEHIYQLLRQGAAANGAQISEWITELVEGQSKIDQVASSDEGSKLSEAEKQEALARLAAHTTGVEDPDLAIKRAENLAGLRKHARLARHNDISRAHNEMINLDLAAEYGGSHDQG